MSKPNYTHITLLLDRSGSMRNEAYTVKKQILDLLDDQLNLALGEVSFTINLFDSRSCIKTDKSLYALKSFVNTKYRAGGGTALYDCLKETIENVANNIALKPEYDQPSKNIFIIVTDGRDESSRRIESPEELKPIINHFEDLYQWEFLFLGARQDAYKIGSRMGIKPGKALSFIANQDGFIGAAKAINNTITKYRKDGAPEADQFFTTEDHEYQRNLGAARAPISGIDF